jgi:hypothetical protein
MRKGKDLANLHSGLRVTIYKFFPALLVFVALFGFLLALLSRNKDIFAASFTLIVPLLVAGLVLVFSRARQKDSLRSLVRIRSPFQFSHLVMLTFALYLCSLILQLFSNERPLAYFVMVAIMAGLLLLQIYSHRSPNTAYIVLLEISLLSLNLIWGLTLKYPLYFQDTDILGHMHLIDVIIGTGHLDQTNIAYSNYPLYHILISEGVQLTDLSIRTALFVIMGLLWQIGILFSYLIFHQITRSRHFASLGSLLFSLCAFVVFYGSYGIARSLAFVLFLIWLYLLIRKPRHIIITSSCILIMMAMIATHHLTVLQIIPVIIALFLFEKYLSRSSPNTKTPITLSTIVLLVICFTTYLLWVASSLAELTFPQRLQALLSMNSDLSADFTRGYGPVVVIGLIYASIALFFCLLGLAYFLKAPINNRKKDLTSFASVGALFLFAFVPGMELFKPVDVLGFERIRLLISVFVIILLSFGILHLWKLLKCKYLSGSLISSGIITLLTFFSLISTGNAQDATYFPHTRIMDTPYFRTSEICSFNFVVSSGKPDILLSSDIQVFRNEYAFYPIEQRTIFNFDKSNYNTAYLLFRIGELNNRGALTFWNDDGYYRYRPDPVNQVENIFTFIEDEDIIYSNNANQIVLISRSLD